MWPWILLTVLSVPIWPKAPFRNSDFINILRCSCSQLLPSFPQPKVPVRIGGNALGGGARGVEVPYAGDSKSSMWLVVGSRPLTTSLIQWRKMTTMCYAMGTSNVVTPVVLRCTAKLPWPDCTFLSLVVNKRRCVPQPEPHKSPSQVPACSGMVLELPELHSLRWVGVQSH